LTFYFSCTMKIRTIHSSIHLLLLLFLLFPFVFLFSSSQNAHKILARKSIMIARDLNKRYGKTYYITLVEIVFQKETRKYADRRARLVCSSIGSSMITRSPRVNTKRRAPTAARRAKTKITNTRQTILLRRYVY